jgi:hypothetical protein
MVYFTSSIFLSAFLLFQVQPIIARTILPWFGGTSAVWSTVQMFFQVLLTGGYAYANWLVRKGRRGELIHLALVSISLGLIGVLGFYWKSPITPGTFWRPGISNFPVWEICKILLVSVGLPYFLLSTNSPLIQVWFHRVFPWKTAYRLYGLSNAGSLLGLVTYPVLVEPYLPLAIQGRLWSLMYAAYVVLTGYGVIKSFRAGLGSSQSIPTVDQISNSRPGAGDYGIWIALAATASILLLATTSQITQEVAVIPFLWVLPLTIYLLSFVLAFSSERWYSRQIYLIIFFITTLLASWAMGRSDTINIPIQVGIYSSGLFAACMVCNGELYRLRPHSTYLTHFYLMVSVGGALGGILITFVAPFIFKGYWELPLGYVLCWMIFLALTILKMDRKQRGWKFILKNVILFSMVIVTIGRTFQLIHVDLGDNILIQRNYYGVIRVRDLDAGIPPDERYVLVHGVTIHGYQYRAPEKRDIPTAYFSQTGGGGLALRYFPRSGSGMKVGVLGLGIGTLAAYGQPGDVYRFYEINPLVIDLAKGKGGYFNYLSDSMARIEIVPGDARISLEIEFATSGSLNYDVLILDVFSSDSIPVHLLDKESFDLYLQNLVNNGILGVHISNRHLDLVPVVWTLADHFNLRRIVIDDPGNGLESFPSVWVLLSRDFSTLNHPELLSRARNMDDYQSNIRLWTDDYSNLFQILK